MARIVQASNFDKDWFNEAFILWPMNDYECACVNDDLRPCDSDFSVCKPGYKHETPCHPDHDWIISEGKNDTTND